MCTIPMDRDFDITCPALSLARFHRYDSLGPPVSSRQTDNESDESSPSPKALFVLRTHETLENSPIKEPHMYP